MAVADGFSGPQLGGGGDPEAEGGARSRGLACGRRICEFDGVSSVRALKLFILP